MTALARLPMALITAALLQGQPSQAATVYSHERFSVPVEPLCGGGVALWRAAETDDLVRPVLSDAVDGIHRRAAARPKGTYADIWSCKVGGRQIVIKQQADLKGTGECSATVRGFVSVWIDRVKVVNQLDSGDYARCFNDPTLVSVRFDASGRMTLCEDTSSQAEADGHIRCTVTRSTGWPDKAFVPPDRRTPPGLELRAAKAPFCAGLTARLKPFPGGGLEALITPEAREPLERPDPRSEGIRVRYDLDNDGHPDEVVFGYTLKVHGDETGAVSWAGSRGQLHDLRELPRTVSAMAVLPENDSYVAFSVLPVTIEGRRYIYAQRHSVRDAGEVDPEARAGASAHNDDITRGLLEAHPGGETTLVCGWGPRSRPEEAL